MDPEPSSAPIGRAASPSTDAVPVERGQNGHGAGNGRQRQQAVTAPLLDKRTDQPEEVPVPPLVGPWSELAAAIDARTARVCVVGLGYVGAPLLRLAHDRGFPAMGLDVDAGKVEASEAAGCAATAATAEALADADIVAICVPTPIDGDQRPDLTIVKTVAADLAAHLRPGMLIVLESTVAPGTCEEVLLPILATSGLEPGVDFQVAHCPERIDPGNVTWDVHNLPRVVAGLDAVGTHLAARWYEELVEAEIVRLSQLKAAEAVKVVENTFRDVNIAFVNELARSFDQMGVDLSEVLRGAATKPFGFLPHMPGCGVGGHCIAVDPYYLIERARKSGFDHRFLKLAREINSSMPEYTVQRLTLALNEVGRSVRGAQVAVLGLAYKRGVSDVRESPAFPIITAIEKLGGNVVRFDPYVPDRSDVATLEAALSGSDAVVLVTDHEAFTRAPVESFAEAGVQAVVDGRNALDAEGIRALGITYCGIGR